MKQKNATPTREQQRVLESNGLNPFAWVVEKDKEKYLIIKNRLTGEFRAIGKEKSV